MMGLKRLLEETKLGVHVLVCVFAISSWVDINGMWVELPIFVTLLPEKWTLPSYITVLGQIANIGPIVFLLIAYCLKKRNATSRASKLTLDKVTSYVIMIVGLISTLLLAFLWQRTATLLGSERSVALLGLSFCLSLMDTTSSLAYVAFVSRLKAGYLATFFLGEGLSGLVPGLLALGQGAGDVQCVNGSSTSERNESGVETNVTTYYQYPTYTPPRFSVQLFFFFLSGLIALSIAAFTLLNQLSYCKGEFVSPESPYEVRKEVMGEKEKMRGEGPPSYSSVGSVEGPGKVNPVFLAESTDVVVSEGIRSLSSESSSGEERSLETTSSSSGSANVTAKGKVSTATMLFLLTQVVVINFLIVSFLLSVQVYSSLPYGIAIYNLVVTLTSIANPVACVVALVLPLSTSPAISALTSLGCACAAYIVVAAAMSPAPPLVGHAAGGPVVVLVWVGAAFFLTYAKVAVAGVLRGNGRRALIWYGVATQLGALIGAVTAFVLVNEVKLFRDAAWC